MATVIEETSVPNQGIDEQSYWEENFWGGTDDGSSPTTTPTVDPDDISSGDEDDANSTVIPELPEQKETLDPLYVVDDISSIVADRKRDSDIQTDATRPLWEVWMNGEYQKGDLLYSSNADNTNRLILQPQLNLEINDPGSFSFTILPSHPLYSRIIPYGTDFTIYSEGVEIFRGRVKSLTTDIYRQRSVQCEGDLAYLSDVVFKINDGQKKEYSVGKLFVELINEYNEEASKSEVGVSNTVINRRLFTGGKADTIDKMVEKVVAAEKQSPKVTIEEDTYRDARSYIDDLISTYGGYVRTKRTKEGIVVEYLESDTATSPQILYYGGTIQTLSLNDDMTDFCTILIPEGDAEETTSTDSKKGNLTLSSANEYSSDGLVHLKGDDMLVWIDGVSKYGRIMKTQSFSGITKASSLLSRSIQWMKNMMKSLEGNISLKAVDMHFLNDNVRPIYLGDRVHLVSTLHGINTIDSDTPLTCMGIKYDMTAPENTEYSFDVPYHMPVGNMTKQYKKDKKKTAAKVNKANTKATKAQTAAEKAQNEVNSVKDRVKAIEKKLSADDINFKTVNASAVYTTTLKIADRQVLTMSPALLFDTKLSSSNVATIQDMDGIERYVLVVNRDEMSGNFVMPLKANSYSLLKLK